MYYLAAAVLSSFLIAGQQGPATPDQVDPRTELRSTIEFALELLDEEKHQEYIEKLAFPADLKTALKSRELDDLVASFSKDKSKVTLAVLKKIKSIEPKLNEAGTVAEFPVDTKYFFARDKIVFEKADGLWYIRN